jgi:hypothetical protein
MEKTKMAATFDFVGKLKKIEKETEKFKAFDEKRYDSGWTNQTFKFNAVNGNNSHIMQIRAGFWSKPDGSVDVNKMKIYARSKTDGGAKSQQLEVAFADRANPEILDKIAYFSKSGINLNRPGEEKVASNDHEYLFEGDFMTALRKLMDNPNFTSRRVHIKGTMDIQYGESTGIFYQTFVPSRVWFANDDEPDMMKLSIDLIYGPGAVDEDDDILRVNCYHRYYDSNYKNDSCKGQATCPIQFVVRDKQFFDSIRRRFSNFPDECTFAKLDATLDVINGTEMVPIRYEDLSEDARENIDFGFTTLEEEVRAAGGTVYGNRVTELRFRGTRNVQGTAYEAEDLCSPRHDGTDEVDDTSSGLSIEKKADDEDFDLFGDL